MIFEESAAIVGLVLLLQNSVKPPDVKPFNCLLCSSFWLAVIWSLFDFKSAIVRIGMTALFSFIVMYFMPELTSNNDR